LSIVSWVDVKGSEMAESIPGYPRHYPQDRSLRASNADRDAIGDILRRQHAAGRLDTDEFGERYGRSLQAKTYAELDGLIADFPADGEPASDAGSMPLHAQPAGSRAGNTTWRGSYRPAIRLPRPVLVLICIALVLGVASHGHLLWVAFPLFFFVVRPLMWRSGSWGQRGGGGRWGCSTPTTKRGTTVV
jgi:hypothetical protein